MTFLKARINNCFRFVFLHRRSRCHRMNESGTTPAGLNSTSDSWWNNTSTSATNSTDEPYIVDEADDAIWILTSTFIIFTMQSGKTRGHISECSPKGAQMTTLFMYYFGAKSSLLIGQGKRESCSLQVPSLEIHVPSNRFSMK